MCVCMNACMYMCAYVNLCVYLCVPGCPFTTHRTTSGVGTYLPPWFETGFLISFFLLHIPGWLTPQALESLLSSSISDLPIAMLHIQPLLWVWTHHTCTTTAFTRWVTSPAPKVMFWSLPSFIRTIGQGDNTGTHCWTNWTVSGQAGEIPTLYLKHLEVHFRNNCLWWEKRYPTQKQKQRTIQQWCILENWADGTPRASLHYMDFTFLKCVDIPSPKNKSEEGVTK